MSGVLLTWREWDGGMDSGAAIDVLKDGASGPALGAFAQDWTANIRTSVGHASPFLFDPPRTTRGVRITAPRRGRDRALKSVLPLVALGDADASPGARQATPFEVPFTMPMSGFVAIDIQEKKTGARVRRLVAETARDEGDVREGWICATTRAIRYRAQRLSFSQVMSRRLNDIAGEARRIFTEGDLTPQGGVWVARRGAAFSRLRPAIAALSWPRERDIRGLSLMRVGEGEHRPRLPKRIAVDAWRGGDADVKAALGDDGLWTLVAEFDVPDDITLFQADFCATIRASALRIRSLAGRRASQGVDAYVSGFHGIVVYEPAGGDPADLPAAMGQRIAVLKLPPPDDDESEAQPVVDIPLPEPNALAFDARGVLHCLSAGQIVTVPLTPGESGRVVVSRDKLVSPVHFTFGPKGMIYLTDNGPKVVKVFDPAGGGLVRVIGTPGGPASGLWDPLKLENPAQVAVDKDGKVWVADLTYTPKRIMVFNPDGSARTWFLGPTQYGGGGSMDPQDRSIVMYNGMKFRIDWKTRTWKLEALLGHDVERLVYHRGRRYIVGHFTVGDEEFFVNNSDPGDWYCYTAEGMLVGGLFGGPRGYGTRSWPARWEAGATELVDLRLGQEHYQGCVVKANDGNVYAVAGHNHMSIVRIDGLAQLRRLKGRITVTENDILATRRWRQREDRLASAREEPRVAKLLRAGFAPAISGTLEEWPAELFLSIATTVRPGLSETLTYLDARAAVGYDAANLYFAIQVRDESPLRNAAEDLKTVFKGGDAAELTLGLDGGADPARLGPVAGDLRLLFTMVRGRPVAVLYKPVDPGAPDGAAMKFVSPVGETRMDRVEILTGARVAAQNKNYKTEEDGVLVEGTYWELEAAVAWRDFGAKAPEQGTTIRGDLGYLQSDEHGMRTVGRRYWSGRTQTVVSDTPSEARLAPSLWGEFVVTSPSDDLRFDRPVIGTETLEGGGIPDFDDADDIDVLEELGE